MVPSVLSPVIDKVLAVSFAASLAGVGAMTLSEFKSEFNIAKLIKGETQATIETEFATDNFLSSAAIPLIGALRYAVFSEGAPGVHVGQESWLFTTEEFQFDPSWPSNTSSAADYVAQVHDLLAAQNVGLFPVLVPDKAEVYYDKLGFDLQGQPGQRRTLFRDALTDRGIPAWDAMPALEMARRSGPAFMMTDTHWSPLGARYVAETSAAILSQTGPDLTRVSVTTTKGAEQAFDGDLLPFVPTGALRPIVGPAHETIDVYSTEVVSGSDLFGTTEPEVALVGTSFSARSEFNFLGFLQQSLNADIVSYAQEGRGPFAPMRDFLASDFFKNAPPKLVIWEIPVRYVSKEIQK